MVQMHICTLQMRWHVLLMDMHPMLPKHTTQASMVSLLYFYAKLVIFIDDFLVSRTICDEYGNDILPDTHQIIVLMTRHHTIIVLSLKLQTSYTIITRGLMAMPITYFTSVQPLQPPIMILCLSQITPKCMQPLT